MLHVKLDRTLEVKYLKDDYLNFKRFMLKTND